METMNASLALDAIRALAADRVPLVGEVINRISLGGTFRITIRCLVTAYDRAGNRNKSDRFIAAAPKESDLATSDAVRFVRFYWNGDPSKFDVFNVALITPEEKDDLIKRSTAFDFDAFYSIKETLLALLTDTNKAVDASAAVLFEKKKQELVEREAGIVNKESEIDASQQRLKDQGDQITAQLVELRFLRSEVEPFLPLVNDRTHVAATSIEPIRDLGALYHLWPSLLNQFGYSVPGSYESAVRAYLISVLAAWLDGSLVLLDGPVGAGKTKIVKASSLLLAGDASLASVLPVRPGWLDSTDLLGFYDPINKRFQPTAFTTAVVSAGERPDRLSLLCLDELNLARIENYGADLLSRLEYATEGAVEQSASLPLYSPDIARAEFRRRKSGLSEDDHDWVANFSRYKPELPIPRNLGFLGTLNSDETTYELSPKVIDRSFTVSFGPAIFEATPPVAVSSLPSRYLDLGEFRNQVEDVRNKHTADNWKELVEINEKYLTQGLGLPLSHRTRRHFATFDAVSRSIGLDDPAEIVAQFIAVKILPRIRFSKRLDGGQAAGDTVLLATRMVEHLRKLSSKADLGTALNGLQRQIDNQSQQLVRYFGAD